MRTTPGERKHTELFEAAILKVPRINTGHLILMWLVLLVAAVAVFNLTH
jgi:hypothetical protein